MVRSCSRPTCSDSAATTLSYDYPARTVWLDHLTSEAHPMTHDMCLVHADGLVVPLGWTLEDRRTPLLRSA